MKRGLPAPEPAWSFDYPAYFSGGDLASSVIAADVIVLAKEFEAGALIGLDPATGATRFERGGVAALRDDRGALYLMSIDAAPGTFGGSYALIEVDPMTGDPRRVVALDPPLPSFPMARFAIAGARLLVVTDGELAAYDLASGQRAWLVNAPEASHLFRPALLRDRVVVPGTTYAAYALADGAPLWKRAGECCTALVSPDGAHLYLRTALAEGAEVDDRGQTVHAFAGSVEAVADAWVAVKDDTHLRVFRHGGGAPVVALEAPGGFGAIALHGDWLFYFDSRDATLWLHELVSGERVKLHQAHARLVVSPDATGTAPAFVGDPPVIAPPLALVLDWAVHAYRIDRGH